MDVHLFDRSTPPADPENLFPPPPEEIPDNQGDSQ
jgi:hypothetical protein